MDFKKITKDYPLAWGVFEEWINHFRSLEGYEPASIEVFDDFAIIIAGDSDTSGITPSTLYDFFDSKQIYASVIPTNTQQVGQVNFNYSVSHHSGSFRMGNAASRPLAESLALTNAFGVLEGLLRPKPSALFNYNL